MRSPSGAPFTVSPLHADRFGALVSDLERAGVRIDPSQSGGFANRNIAGTSVPSQHSFGRAVDVNWRDNPRAGPGGSLPDSDIARQHLERDMGGSTAPITQMHPMIAREIAERNGMTWVGNWNNPDPMHFEVARGDLPPVPVQNRAFTAFAGAQPQPPPVAPPPPHSATPPPQINPDAIVRGASQAQAERQPWETTTQAASNPYVDAIASAMAKFEPAQARPASMGLLSSMGAPAPPQASGWVSNPFQQRQPGMRRAQFGLT